MTFVHGNEYERRVGSLTDPQLTEMIEKAIEEFQNVEPKSPDYELSSDEEARMTAALENAAGGRTIGELNSIVRYIIRGAKVKESREFARTVQSRLRLCTEAEDRGIRRAPFIVLIGAEAPSILVELGFMSNVQDERLLKSGEYRDKLAQALMEALRIYVKTMDQASRGVLHTS